VPVRVAPWSLVSCLVLVAIGTGCPRSNTAGHPGDTAITSSETDAALRPTVDARRSSFEPFRNETIGGAPLEEFVALRTGVVTADVAVLATSMQFTGLSGAAAISSDGYFITAAHVVSGAAPWLYAQVTSGSFVLDKPRVVWVGSDIDLALLKVHHPVAACFEWSAPADAADGADVVGVGFSPLLGGGTYDHGSLWVPFGGHALAPLESVGSGSEPAFALRFAAPVYRGDSGCPVVTTRGGLLAIHVSIDVSLRRDGGAIKATNERALALRPDLSWLERTLERDRVSAGRE
jgi:S1-C subfamily serine protease